ncbi:hypothetical protein FRC14_003140 [Serendipita sp. 396]|nr:hypothetical protein FRC14_003140 [Serendipita sp. 396]KAG8874809.1 hypothetical protein FRC20_005237 [Serendipita sp. 405]
MDPTTRAYDPSSEGAPELSMDRVEVINKLDNALSIVQQTFRQVVGVLQHHRNSLHPVSTLPFDVLAHIFKYNDIHSVIKASYVCRWWREVVITSPSLWTLASIRTGEYVKKSSSRSDSLPLIAVIIPSTGILQRIDPGHYGSRIQTMELCFLTLAPHVLLTYLLDFVVLDHLSLYSCNYTEGDSDTAANIDTTANPTHRRSFSFLSFKKCSSAFLAEFLQPHAPNGIGPMTDLVISPGTSITNGIPRDFTISTLRVNASKGIFFYTPEGGGRIWIEEPLNPSVHAYARVPSFIPVKLITTVTCTGNTPLQSHELAQFSNLHELSIVFVAEENQDDLGMILDSGVVSNCPKLRYLRIKLPYTVTRSDGRPLLQWEDDAEKILPKFLENWNEKYKEEFGKVVIEDQLEYSRWKKDRLTERIALLVRTFEVLKHVTEEREPKLPAMSPFNYRLPAK